MGTWPPIEERFWPKVDKTSSPNGCWIWQGKTKVSGYGQIYYNGKFWVTHRLSYALLKGEIPEGKEVCHNCPGGDNRLCVNPDHLWTGTHKENMQDRNRKGRSKGEFGLGEAHINAKLTKEKVIEIRTLVAQGVSYVELAEVYKVSPTAIFLAYKRITWKHVA
jgi:hypothetical protein